MQLNAQKREDLDKRCDRRSIRGRGCSLQIEYVKKRFKVFKEVPNFVVKINTLGIFPEFIGSETFK